MTRERAVSNIVRFPDPWRSSLVSRPVVLRDRPAQVIILPMIRYGALGIPAGKPKR